jgi:hypothetical protein
MRYEMTAELTRYVKKKNKMEGVPDVNSRCCRDAVGR